MTKTLAERLKWARNRRNWSQEQLADAAGVRQSTIGNLESGQSQTARKITAIASALEVSAVWLAEGTGSPAVTAEDGKRSTDTSEVRLQWINDEESLMLSLYRGTDEDGRDSLLQLAKLLPSVAVQDRAKK